MAYGISEREYRAFLQREFGDLVGAEILGVAPNGMYGEYGPLLMLRTRDNRLVHLAVWRDEEGNGPGALARTLDHRPKPGHFPPRRG